MKQCTKCGELKELAEFNKDKGKKDGHHCNCRKCAGEAQTKRNRANGMLQMSDNKSCPAFLGIAIAERLVRHLFNDVEVMPNNNPGFDFFCNQGKKIDVKSSCIILDKNMKNPHWQFHIRENTVADYFLLLAFDNRAYLEPQHQWLIPGDVLNQLQTTSISSSTISKWDEYRQDIEKAANCCNTMKGE